MKSRCFKSAAVAVALIATASAHGAGFALYEGSTTGTALGGAVMGKAADASANFYNAATLSDFTNTVITVGFVTEHPRANSYVDGRYAHKMNAGRFILPHLYVAQPIGHGFTFGLGFAPEYGLGTHYNQNWEMSWNTRQTTVMGLSLNPNLSYAINDDWSVAVGLRLMYFAFDQYSSPWAAKDGSYYGQLRNHLKGDNGMLDWGWQLATRYKFTDRISAGLQYRSYIDTKVKGYTHTRVRNVDYADAEALARAAADAQIAPYAGLPIYEQIRQQAYQQAYAQAHKSVDSAVNSAAKGNSGSASAKIRLPQSITAGVNWDVTDTVHLGSALTWTEWSSMKEINFHLPSGVKTTNLSWHDVFRVGLGGAWDFHDNFSLMGSYVYDIDPCSRRKDNGSTMLPPGDRHIGNVGVLWHWKQFELSLSYGLVYMVRESLTLTDSLGMERKFKTKRGVSHQVGLSLSYRF